MSCNTLCPCISILLWSNVDKSGMLWKIKYKTSLKHDYVWHLKRIYNSVLCLSGRLDSFSCSFSSTVILAKKIKPDYQQKNKRYTSDSPLLRRPIFPTMENRTQSTNPWFNQVYPTGCSVSLITAVVIQNLPLLTQQPPHTVV
jgi:hypothetical protein